MADPARLQLLAVLLTDPQGEADAVRLAGGRSDPTALARHLEAMAEVDLLDRVAAADDGPVYRPTHDAFARFGSLAAGDAPGPGGIGDDHSALLARVTQRLSVTFAGVFAPETVERYVHESYDLLAGRARVRRHLPALTDRFAADRLAALARAEGRASRDGVGVLFVCVRNSGRSQMAAAITRALAGPDVWVRTAGSSPSGRVDPLVRQVLASRGWGRTADFPKPLTEEVVLASDVVVTMGCGDACPVFPGRRYVDWPVPDPRGRDEVEVGAIVADVEQRVRSLLDDLRPR